MKIATASQMREMDRQTIEEIGIPGAVLMENAGRGTVDFMEQHYGPVHDKLVCIFVGPGNNGGDGLVIARTVENRGGYPYIFYLVDPDKLPGDAGLNYRVAEKMGIASTILNGEHIHEKILSALAAYLPTFSLHSLVDAIFGIGLARAVEGHILDAVDSINTLRKRVKAPVISVDIASGVNSDSGELLGGAVQADLTVTYGLPKPAHFHHGSQHTGILEIVDISIPESVTLAVNPEGEILDQSIGACYQQRGLSSHKGTTGHLLILAGSAGKTGAAILCAQGAMRAGAGLVSMAAPHQLNPIFETTLAEAMTIPLANSPVFLTIDDYDILIENMEGRQAVVIGPGLGTHDSTQELVQKIYRHCPLPVVIDADGLNLLAGDQSTLFSPGGPRIFTPHPGEMARLLQTTTKAIQADRLAAADWIDPKQASSHEMITILKGAGTLVAQASGRWAINTTGNAGMATGGMGDVLAGMVASFLVQGYAPWESACLATYAHGRAADMLATTTLVGYSASEVATMVPAVLKEFTLYQATL